MVTDFFAAVGARIREIRIRSGMSQGAFAAAAGMNERYAWRVEHGLQNLSLLTIGRSALALGVSPAAFFEDVDVDASILTEVVRKNARGAGGAPAKSRGATEVNTSQHSGVRFFIEKRPDGRFSVTKPNAARPSAVADTQDQAIAKARTLDPEAVIHVERLPGVDRGRGRWRLL